MCGILGIVLADQSEDVAAELLDGAMFLQHRGQDAAGIVTCAGGRFYQCKGNGMAKDVLTEQRMKGLVGNMGIAQLRYPTAGSSAMSEAQPFYVNSPYGIALSHNGNLVNGRNLRQKLDDVLHRHINTDSDSELLLNIFAAELAQYDKKRVNSEDIFKALVGVYRECRGAYACVSMLAGYGIIGFRDPHGIRPLVVGERVRVSQTPGDTHLQCDYMLASESVVLKAHGFHNFRDILPGEAVIITKRGPPEFCQIVPAKAYTPDIFEYVYFARPDSIMDGISVYRSRLAMGRKLAQKITSRFTSQSLNVAREIDVVIPVPDTSRPSALECAVTLGIPFREGFVKNRYVGRTFIMPNQKERTSSVRRKLNAMSSEFAGRNVLLIDDSIVRGTTSKEIVNMAREAGANKVYFASCSPVIRYNHIYGIDLADSRALVGFGRSEREVSDLIGADDVIYQSLDDLKSCCVQEPELPSELPSTRIAFTQPPPKINGFEVGVFTGVYVTGEEDHYLKELEQVRAKNERSRINGCGIDVKAETDISLFNRGES
ncbi:amidophosphoribosyltransferase [Komagataella kurtzmanii]|nr:amidophosphoribosyltransferase [Komagataella kurtzmanii]